MTYSLVQILYAISVFIAKFFVHRSLNATTKQGTSNTTGGKFRLGEKSDVKSWAVVNSTKRKKKSETKQIAAVLRQSCIPLVQVAVPQFNRSSPCVDHVLQLHVRW